jgi:hypothetical protein
MKDASILAGLGAILEHQGRKGRRKGDQQAANLN